MTDNEIVTPKPMTIWRHSKTGRRYIVFRLISFQVADGPLLVLYHEVDKSVCATLAVHSETHQVLIIDLHADVARTPALEGATLTMEGTHLWARPVEMWYEEVMIEGRFRPRFEREVVA